jgi:hypothetical protein
VQPIARGDFGGALCDKWQALAPRYCESMTDINRSFFTVVMTKEFFQEVKDCRNVDEVRYLGATSESPMAMTSAACTSTLRATCWNIESARISDVIRD